MHDDVVGVSNRNSSLALGTQREARRRRRYLSLSLPLDDVPWASSRDGGSLPRYRRLLVMGFLLGILYCKPTAHYPGACQVLIAAGRLHHGCYLWAFPL